MLNDFKLIHQATNKRMAEHSLANFVDHWRKRYPKVTQALLKNQKLLVFFNFPPAIRSSIYVPILSNHLTQLYGHEPVHDAKYYDLHELGIAE